MTASKSQRTHAPPISPAAIAAKVSAWFARTARPLPWRTSPREPWASLVSEVMAQQTQIARVVEKFACFLDRFPTPRALAEAGEDRVLAAWTGLGYYRRARMLHTAAREIVSRFGGHVPSRVEELLSLPGVGRYTAGAVASIAFNAPEPIVDGNVTRVLLRLHGKPLASDDPKALRWTWALAETLVKAADDPAAFNEGLMELGATVCTPRNPRCGSCPLARHCTALSRGAQHTIPRPKSRPRSRRLVHATLIAFDRTGRLAIERRAAGSSAGLWAGLWQLPTIESEHEPDPTALAKRWGIGALPGEIARFDFKTSACLVRFVVYAAEKAATHSSFAAWRTLSQARALAMSSPQRRVLRLAEHLTASPPAPPPDRDSRPASSLTRSRPAPVGKPRATPSPPRSVNEGPPRSPSRPGASSNSRSSA